MSQIARGSYIVLQSRSDGQPDPNWFSRDVRKKLKLKILSFYLHQVKVMFKHTPLACLQLGRSLCLKIEHVTHVTRENNDSPYVF